MSPDRLMQSPTISSCPQLGVAQPSSGARLPWNPPRVQPLGSLTHLLRAASGPLGDKATAVGKRGP